MPVTAPTRRFARRRAALDEDGHLLHRAAEGDDSAFEEFHDRHVDPLLHYCQHLLGSRHEAEDAVQQTFFNAYREITAGRLPSKPKAWLYAIARNRSLSVMRMRREQPSELVEATAALTLTEEVERRADLRELVHDLNRLPEDQRSAIVLFELADLPQADIADVIGREPEQVKSLVYQARSTLMARRAAREASCEVVQQEISVARRGQLNSRMIRNHVDGCAECAEYLEEVRRHRRRLAAIFPAAPVLAASAARDGAVVAGAAQGRRVGQAQVAAGSAAGVVVAGAIAATLVLGPSAERQADRTPPPVASGATPADVARAPARDRKKPASKSRPRVTVKPAPPAARPKPISTRPALRPATPQAPRSEPPPRRPPPPSPEPEQPQTPAPNAPASQPEPTAPAAPPPTVVATPPEPPPATSPPPAAPPPARHDNGNHFGQIKNGNSGNHTGQQR